MIRLQQVSLRRGAKVVLDTVDLTLHPGEKAALVGRNGVGKSSLFALLLGQLHEDAGTVEIPPHWLIAQVAQDMPESELSATDFVMEGDSRLMAARSALSQAQSEEDGEAMAHAHMRLQDAGEHDARARAEALILGLGFAVSELNQPVHQFSGGWRMRLQLARALMCPSDLLLLDEPTNHLDLDALVWLESWLQRYPGTLLVISHDRDFLDATTQVTLHVANGRLQRYSGNYTQFERLRAEQLNQQQLALVRQEQRIAHLQSFIDRFKAKATKARQAQSRVKALERMARVAPLTAQHEFGFAFAAPDAMPNPMLQMREVSIGYAAPDQPPKVIGAHMSCSVLPGQRIGVLGANGQGKSTLIKTLAGTLSVLSGQVLWGKGLRMGYFAQQELDILRPDESALQHITRWAREGETQGWLSGQSTREQDLRNVLGQFLFTGDMVHQPVGQFSGGEKARLVLCLMVWQRPNLLLLDEPTNHLDLDTREALALALNTFEGSVLVVSHDRALLREVCDEFWWVHDGRLQTFDGDLEDYQRRLLELARQRRQALSQSTPATPTLQVSAKVQRQQQAQARQALLGQIRPLRKALDEIETQLETAEVQRRALETLLATPGTPPDQIVQGGKQLKALSDQTQLLESRWLELSESLQHLEQEPR